MDIMYHDLKDAAMYAFARVLRAIEKKRDKADDAASADDAD